MAIPRPQWDSFLFLATAALLAPIASVRAQEASTARLAIAGGIAWRPKTEAAHLGPSLTLQFGRQISPLWDFHALADAAWHGEPDDIIVDCAPAVPSCTNRTPSDPHFTLGVGLEARRFGQVGERGGYLLAGAGIIRFSRRLDHGSILRPRLHIGVGQSLAVVPGQLFWEGRLSYVAWASSFPRWALGVTGGWRVPL